MTVWPKLACPYANLENLNHSYASAQATYRFPTRRAEPQLQIGAQPSIGSKLSMSRLRVVGS
ncbi:hypothetical protein, partial [Aquimonas sp.]|uniref:hypothetical protein n=1 Tax=Aquimonas sp. TaxID=1872588 RepID=UPI0037BE520D